MLVHVRITKQLDTIQLTHNKLKAQTNHDRGMGLQEPVHQPPLIVDTYIGTPCVKYIEWLLHMAVTYLGENI